MATLAPHGVLGLLVLVVGGPLLGQPLLALLALATVAAAALGATSTDWSAAAMASENLVAMGTSSFVSVEAASETGPSDALMPEETLTGWTRETVCMDSASGGDSFGFPNSKSWLPLDPFVGILGPLSRSSARSRKG